MSNTIGGAKSYLSTSNSATTLTGFSPATGSAVIVYISDDAVNSSPTGVLDNASNIYVEIFNTISDHGDARRVYRCDNIGSVPTTMTIASPVSIGYYLSVVEVVGAPDSSIIDVVSNASSTANGFSHSLSYTPTANNDTAIFFARMGGNPGDVLPTNGFTQLTHTGYRCDTYYLADTGPFGSKTASFSTANFSNVSGVFVLVKAGVTDPTISTVSSPTATEGSSLAFLITLSGATTRDTDYVFTLTGTATGSDYTSTITTAMCDNSVTVSGATGSGGTFTVPSGVSSFTVTVPTTSDSTDEADETVILNLPGSVSGTGTITDDDAPPTVSISDATESFGTVTHTLTLSQASGKTITVQVDSANGSKTAGTHYTAITAHTVTFLPGETEQTVTVTVL